MADNDSNRKANVVEPDDDYDPDGFCVAVDSDRAWFISGPISRDFYNYLKANKETVYQQMKAKHEAEEAKKKEAEEKAKMERERKRAEAEAKLPKIIPYYKFQDPTPEEYETIYDIVEEERDKTISEEDPIEWTKQTTCPHCDDIDCGWLDYMNDVYNYVEYVDNTTKEINFSDLEQHEIDHHIEENRSTLTYICKYKCSRNSRMIMRIERYKIPDCITHEIHSFYPTLKKRKL